MGKPAVTGKMTAACRSRRATAPIGFAISIASPSSVHGPTRMRCRAQPKRLRDFRLVLLGVEHSEALAARRESNLCIGREEDVDPSLQGRGTWMASAW